MKEVLRVIKPRGVFAFTVAAQTSEDKNATGDNPQGYSETPTPCGIAIFTHSDGYIANLLQDHGFDMLKTQKILIRGGNEDSDDMLFKACVARRAGPGPS